MQTNVERVKEKMDIVTVVSGYVQLKKAGGLLKACCPFHNEKSPSFTVSPVRQTYHCFGCNEHGDIFTFVQKIEGVDFREALELLAQKGGITLENERGEARGVPKDERETLLAINEAATLSYEINLKNAPEISAYLTSRGLSEKTLSLFRVGFAKESWQDTLDSLTSRGYTAEQIEKTGLALKSEKSTSKDPRYYDRFRSRIMFPIPNAQGKVVGFTGRIWTPQGKTPDATSAKYVNTPETALYHKSSVLYGLHIAKHHIRPMNCVLIVEGQMDLLSCHQVGYTNAVAISGTALTDAQVQLLSRLTKNFLLALDSDTAGTEATLKSLSKALEYGCDVKVVSFNGKDASEVLQKEGTASVKECIKTASDWCQYVLEVIERRAEGNERIRSRLIHETLLPLISILENPLERETLLKVVSSRTALSLTSLQESLRSASQKRSAAETQSTHSRTSVAPVTKSSPSARALLSGMLEIPEVQLHERYPQWKERCSALNLPVLGLQELHEILVVLPPTDDAFTIEECVEEMLERAEREYNSKELDNLVLHVRSLELAGDEAGAEAITRKIADIHARMHNLQKKD